MALYQTYVTVRFLLSQQKRPLTRRQKWLLIARLLDALEHDYRQVYPDDMSPFDEGYEESIRKLMTLGGD
ncbi:hypothetical protein SAMN06298211_101462 [Prevotellaceae bacterium MN60]|nr:hypothetical protein SAMN06298211_101462 [Prevotellaceae bacterium MN60]